MSKETKDDENLWTPPVRVIFEDAMVGSCLGIVRPAATEPSTKKFSLWVLLRKGKDTHNCFSSP